MQIRLRISELADWHLVCPLFSGQASCNLKKLAEKKKTTGADLLTEELKKMSASELAEAGDKYKELIE